MLGSAIVAGKEIVKRLLPGAFKPIIMPRRVHSYCVGLPKTGTTSLATMFAGKYRSQHEPAYEEIFELLRSGRPRDEIERIYRKRDRRLWLELESAWFNGMHADVLRDAFDDASFILTIRNPYTWVDAIFDSSINFFSGVDADASVPDRAWLDFLFGRRGGAHSEHERELESLNLYPLRSYLERWTSFNRAVLSSIPSQRLLVLRTEEISTSAAKIARFLGIDPADIEVEKSHARPSAKKHCVLARLDSEFVRESIERDCGELMREQLPDLLPCRKNST